MLICFGDQDYTLCVLSMKIWTSQVWSLMASPSFSGAWIQALGSDLWRCVLGQSTNERREGLCPQHAKRHMKKESPGWDSYSVHSALSTEYIPVPSHELVQNFLWRRLSPSIDYWWDEERLCDQALVQAAGWLAPSCLQCGCATGMIQLLLQGPPDYPQGW